MKNYILIAFAVGSLYLSFTFEERAPAQQQETLVPQESLLWTEQEDLLTAESLVYQHLAMRYEPAAPVSAKRNRKRTTGSKSRTRSKARKGRSRAAADSVQLAYVADNKLQHAAAQWLGTPYRSGNNSKRGTDCSGFVQKIYQQVYGITLSRSSRSMFHEAQPINPEDLREGDLVFFKRKTGPIYHVGIYLKDGKFIHSATNGGVMVNSLHQGYYSRHFYSAGRIDLN